MKREENLTLLVGDRVIVVEGEHRGRTGHVAGRDWELPLWGLHVSDEERPYPIQLEDDEPPRRISYAEWLGLMSRVSGFGPGCVTLPRKALRRYPKSMPVGKAKKVED